LPGNRKHIILAGQEYSYVGTSKNQRAASTCEGAPSPATSLLLRCEAVPGSHSELVNNSGDTLQVVTSGSYGPEIANKPWSVTLTLDAKTLMPLSLDTDTWGLLNNEPTEVHESSTYTTEFVEPGSLSSTLFAPQ
jgi:hypothetical protein